MYPENLNLKQRAAFEKMAFMLFALPWNEYGSSAEQFDRRLREFGVVPPVKLFYQYKLPGDVSGEVYEKHLALWSLPVWFVDGSLDCKAVHDMMNNLVKECTESLTDDERQDLLDKIRASGDAAIRHLQQEVDVVKNLNPELSDISFNSTIILSFLLGVDYGYAPEDIDYFINTCMDEQIAQTQEYYDYLEKLDLRPGHMVRPDRLKKVVDVVKQKCEKTG